MLQNEKKVLLFIFLLILFFRIPTFYQPIFDIDESFFAESGKVILAGGLPYVDAVDNKSPLLLYLIAGVFKLTGSSSLLWIHFAMALIVILTAYFIFLCGKLLKDARAGLWAAFIFAILSNVYEPKNVSANIETLSNFFIALTFFFYLKYWKEKSHFILYSTFSGFSLGFAVLTQWQAGIVFILFFLYQMIFEVFFSGCQRKIYAFLTELKFLIVFGFFAFLPVALMSIYFLKRGCLDAFLFWTLEYNFTYAKIGSSYIPVTQTLSRIGFFILCSFPAWVFSFFYFKNSLKNSFLALKKRNLSPDYKLVFFLLLSLFAFFYIVTLGKRAYGHYFLLLFIPLSLAGSFYLFEKQLSQGKKIAFFLIFGCVFLFPRIHLDTMYQLTGNSFGKADMEYRLTADFLKEKAQPKDKILAWGYATPIYYYSNLAPATRFLSSDTLVGRLSIPDSMKVDVNELLKKNPYSEKLWSFFYQDLKKNKPEWIIDTSPSNYYGYGRFRIDFYPHLQQYILENYTKKHQIGLFDIYRRKN